MASTKYTYSVSGDTANGVVYPPTLITAIEGSSIATAFEQIEVDGDVLDIWFVDPLSGPDQTTLNGLVSAHTGVEQQDLDGPTAPNVLDKDLTTPPGSPSTGDRYIVAASATGAWSGRDDEIAEWDGSQWVFRVPQNCSCYVEDEDARYQYDGNSWEIRLAEVQNLRFAAEYDNGNSGSADTIDWNSAQKQRSTLTANCTYTFTAPTSGVGNFLLKLVQGGAGSFTATWPATVKWPGGSAPTLSTTPGDIDILSFYYDGTSYFGVASLDFS